MMQEAECPKCKRMTPTNDITLYGTCWVCHLNKVKLVTIKPNTHPYIASQNDSIDWILNTDPKEVEK